MSFQKWCKGRYTPSLCSSFTQRRRYTVCAGMECVLLVLLLFLTVTGPDVGEAGSGCPQVCSCRASVVDCSHRELTTATLPESFPPSTTEVWLHDNYLTALPTGILDGLKPPRLVTLHGNPWACDCAVLYLRGWLLKQASDALIRNVSCSSPPSLQGRLVVYLDEEEVLDTCRYWMCDLALASQVSLFVFIVVQVLLLAALVHFLRRFDRLTCDARLAASENLTPDSQDISGGNEYVLLKDRSS